MAIVPTDFCSLRTFQEGKTIFKEGERGNCAYVVCEGTVEIVKDVGTGEVTLATCGAGAMFGEMALTDDAGRSATARAKTPTKCLVFPRNRFREFFDQADPFVRGLLRILVANVRETSDSMALFYQALSEIQQDRAKRESDLAPSLD
jgi:CRP/FNR family transcriptional regulator, cyclic AMP receptor protein